MNWDRLLSRINCMDLSCPSGLVLILLYFMCVNPVAVRKSSRDGCRCLVRG